MTTLTDVDELVRTLIDRVGPNMTVATPLGLGKPNDIVNALVRAAIENRIETLEIFTALSLAKPVSRQELEKRLMDPILERLVGDYHDLEYVELRASNKLPDNITIREFYYPAGSLLRNSYAQRHYTSVNYTRAMEAITQRGVDVIAQLVTPGRNGGWDLACNPDLTVDLISFYEEREDRPLFVAQVNPKLPAMGHDAEVDRAKFDIVLDDPKYAYDLFATVNKPPSDSEYMIGIQASTLLKDGGTIQVGIGSLGESLCWAAILRHENPGLYQQIVEAMDPHEETRALIKSWGGVEPFEQGLYASTEMFVEGLLHLFKAGVLKREVDDGVVAHGGFFLGSNQFYDMLRNLTDEERDKIRMTSVRFTNRLYGDETRKRAQRVHGRFINEGMKVTALGAVVSDGLADGSVVSGVGGQFEFVSMAQELEDGRSILMIQAVRGHGDHAESNVIWQYGHVTVPRHYRDIIITEYGIADLRGKTDEEVVQALILVADARYQDELAESAKKVGKLSKDYRVPEMARRNTPDWVRKQMALFRSREDLPRTPFGTELTDIELDLAVALKHISGMVKDATRRKVPDLDLGALFDIASKKSDAGAHLERLQLDDPESPKDVLMQKLVIYGLAATGAI